MSSIAYCGLDCSICPALRAHQLNDENLRRQTAEAWSQLYRATIKPEQIACQGCRSEQGPRFAHCDHCQVRACARGKGLNSCADCGDYPCGEVEFILKAAPPARGNLERLRAARQSSEVKP